MPNIVNFIRTDIWRIQLRKTSRKKSFLVKNLRIILLSLRRFNEDKCQLRASALTFYSILSIVPVVEKIETSTNPIGNLPQIYTGTCL